jgi:hypothetical protein
VDTCDPVELVCQELTAFLGAVETRRPAGPGPEDAGERLAVLMESIYRSAETDTVVDIPDIEHPNP